MALLAIANSAAGAIGAVGSVLGIGGTSEKDRERMAKADQLFNAALNGDHRAEVQLRCLSGRKDARAEAVSLGLLSPDEVARGQECGWATSAARAYGEKKLGELAARRTIANVAGDIVPAATKLGTTADSRTFLSTTAGHFAGALPSWVVPASAIAAGLGLFLILRKA